MTDKSEIIMAALTKAYHKGARDGLHYGPVVTHWCYPPMEARDALTMTDKSEMELAMAQAMKKRAAEPLANIPSLEPVLVGSLGDAWPYLARAALTAIESLGYVIVPKE